MNNDQVNPYSPTSLDLELPGRHRRLPLSTHMRITLFIHGVILPGVLLGMSLADQRVVSDSPWQSGRLQDYIAMLLKPIAWMPFGPFILFCMISMGAWAIVPASGAKAWVRVGIYTGVPLALHFWVVLLLIYSGPMIILTALVLPCWHVALWLASYLWRRQINLWHIMAFMTLCALLLVLDRNVALTVLYIPLTAFWFLLLAAPGLNFIAYCIAVWSLFRIETPVSRRTRLGVVGAMVAWVVAWLVAWRFAIVAMLDEYSKLPTTNPNCYLSNAASYAHPWLTGASRRGETTQCMRRLKFLELVFKAAAPALHRIARRYYDSYCPPLARACTQHVYLATATCIALWPVELLAELACWALRIQRKHVERIYSARRTR